MPPLRLHALPGLPPRAAAYLRDVHARILEPNASDAPAPPGAAAAPGAADALPARAAYVFGSLARGEWRPGESDVDLLIVTPDDAPPRALRHARRALHDIARRHGLAPTPTGAGTAIAGRVNAHTGMFRSGFVCTTSDLTEGRVARAFNTSPLGVALVVPHRLVMAGALADATHIWGEDVVDAAGLRERYAPPFPPKELQRSRAMCEAVALLGVALHPLGAGAQYAREATKWALLNAHHVAEHHLAPLDDALAYFQAQGVAPEHLARFSAARNWNAPADWPLVAGAPGAVWRIHEAARA